MISLPTLHQLLPFLTWWPLVNRDSLRADLAAGLTNAVVVLPQGVAFALIAGLPPQYGLYTAMVTPVIAGLFGSSRHLISGPTTAISIVVFSAVSSHTPPGSPEFVQLAITLTFLAGAFQLGFWAARLGAIVDFVSHSVVVGFTTGAALLIATSQLKHILGIDLPTGESFLHVWRDVGSSLGDANLFVLGVAIVTVGVSIAVRRYRPRLPHMLFALIAGGLLAAALGGEARGIDVVGGLPAALPPLSMPYFTLSTIRNLAPEALAIAILGLIEAISIARAVATRSHQRLHANQEFFGQGLSNVVGSFFSCYAASGSFTRTGINYEAGARTPLAGIFAAGILLLLVFFVAPLTAYLPMAAMGGVILLVAWNLIEVHHIVSVMRTSKSETAVMGVTFFATLFTDLEFAIYAGVLLSLVFYLRRAARPKVLSMAPDPEDPRRHFDTFEKRWLTECPQLKIVRIDGSLFFGAVDHVERGLHLLLDRAPRQYHLLIAADGINEIDVSGAEMLLRLAENLAGHNGALYLCKLKSGPRLLLERGRYLERIGESNVFSSKAHAIARIFVKLDPGICVTCQARIFTECPQPREEAPESLPAG